MIKDMDNMCGLIAMILIVLIFMNFQREYQIVHRRAGSACSMASSEQVSAKASLSIEPEAKEVDNTSPLEIGVLNKDVWNGDKKDLTEDELKTQSALDEYISTIHDDKFEEHMNSGCNANVIKPTYQKIIEAGAANRSVTISKPTFSKFIGKTGFHNEARKFYAPDKETCEKPKFDLYFNGNEAHFEAQKCQ